MLESGGLLARKASLLEPLARSTQTRNLPRSHLTVCFLGNLYQLRVPCSQETRGVVLTFQLLQAACHLHVLFLRSMLEGGIWPATEPTEQVWPFLGKHLKGSWQDPEYKAGSTPEGEEESCRKHGDSLSASSDLRETTCWQPPPPPGAYRQWNRPAKTTNPRELCDQKEVAGPGSRGAKPWSHLYCFYLCEMHV